MGNISQITLPDNNTYDIRDAKKSGVYTVIGTQTAATASWTGALHGVSALYTGLTINYYLPYAGVSSTSVTLNLTLDSGSTTGAVNCYLSTSRLTTHYGAGRTIIMTYYAAGDISISGKATTDNRWICDAFYDVDTKVRQSLNTSNNNRPLLMSYTDISNTTTNVDNVSYRNNSIYANPSTGTIYSNNISVAPPADNATFPEGGYIVHDVRNVSAVPTTQAVNFIMTNQGSPINSSWYSGIYCKSSGGEYGAWELVGCALNADNRTKPFYVRNSNKTTAWGDWRKLYDSANPPAFSEIDSKPTTISGYGITDANKEANLEWGGKNFTGDYGCIDAAMVGELGANRLAIFSNKASGITVEYTRDGGTTWLEYDGLTNADKAALFNGIGVAFSIGKADATHKATEHGTDYQLRVTINTGTAGIYTVLNKFVLYITTQGSNDCTCQIQKALESTPTTFIDHTDPISITGWSGYNVINCNALATYGNKATTQYGRIRFIFKANGGSTQYTGLRICKIFGFGGVGWATPSTLAKTGHMYTYGADQSVTFPANLKMNSNKQVGYLTETPTSGKIVVTDGTAGGIKASSFAVPTIVTGTLTSGQTSVTLSNSAIKTTSTFEFFTDKFGVVPTNATVSNGSIVLTFTAQPSATQVKVQVT